MSPKFAYGTPNTTDYIFGHDVKNHILLYHRPHRMKLLINCWPRLLRHRYLAEN